MNRLIYLVILAIFSIGCEGDYTIYDMNPPETIVVEIPVPVPVEIPGEGGDVWVDSFDQPHTINGIDIVWLIDQSCSMIQHSQSVVNGIEAMMLSLPPTGWRLGITTTAWLDSGTSQEFPLVPGDSVQDAWDAYNNAGSHEIEAGFDALYSYLIDNSYNQTWLRPDAGLLVVFVSDENEQSTQDFTSTPGGLQDFISWYGNQRPSVFVASIVNVPIAESVCPPGTHGAFVGDRYIDATAAFGGVVVDICSEDWAPGVQEAATQVEPHEEWELTFTPIEDTLIVLVDSVEFLDWSYNTLTNSVEFLTIPLEGAHVEIGYVIDHFEGDDDDSAGN